MTDGGRHRAWQWLSAGLFALVCGLAGADMIADIGEGAGAGHLLLEGLLFLVGGAGAVTMVLRLRSASRRASRLHDRARTLGGQLQLRSEEARTLNRELRMAEAEAERWRSEARTLMRGLGEAIDQQFQRWGLSQAEKEVALLLLKGLSHKEIAELRSTTDATTRQQARALYRKAGLSSRSDLAAFFLEDLLLPMPPRPESQASAPRVGQEVAAGDEGEAPVERAAEVVAEVTR